MGERIKQDLDQALRVEKELKQHHFIPKERLYQGYLNMRRGDGVRRAQSNDGRFADSRTQVVVVRWRGVETIFAVLEVLDHLPGGKGVDDRGSSGIVGQAAERDRDGQFNLRAFGCGASEHDSFGDLTAY